MNDHIPFGALTTTPDHGFTSFVLFPISFDIAVLLRASSADSGSLNQIIQSVLVVPMLATWASCVEGAFRSAVWIWALSKSVGRLQLSIEGVSLAVIFILWVYKRSLGADTDAVLALVGPLVSPLGCLYRSPELDR